MTKHIIIPGDGMAGWPVKSLGGKTLLQAAKTPYMDKFARAGRVDGLKTVADGFHPGSEVANMSVLGYNLPKVHEKRGPLEVVSIGVDLKPGEMVMRCNIICIEGDDIKNYLAGHITTEEADVLVKHLQEHLGDERARFRTGVQYRHLLVIKGGDKRIDCTPPHGAPLKPYHSLPVRPMAGTEDTIAPEGEADLAPRQTADLINDLIMCSQALLKEHSVNKKRAAMGKDPANSIWPWNLGYRSQMEKFSDELPQVKRGSVASVVDLISGIRTYAGLCRLTMEDATGLYDTNYENKVVAALDAPRTDDFVYLHTEASDEAGHEGDVSSKMQTIENLDGCVVSPVYEVVKDWEKPVAIAVLPDHPTPCELRTYTNEPAPFFIWYPGIESDEVQTFDRVAACSGSYDMMKEDEFINEFMKEL